MTKSLKFGLNTIIVLGYLGIAIGYFLFLTPLTFIIHAVHNNTAQTILNSQTFLSLPSQHQVTATAINSFPNWPYAMIMSIGIIITVWSLIIGLKALTKILDHISDQNYLSQANLGEIKQLIIAQIAAILGDLFLASGNQLTQSWLHRVNVDVLFQSTWANVVADGGILIILAAIYVTYQYAITHQASSTALPNH